MDCRAGRGQSCRTTVPDESSGDTWPLHTETVFGVTGQVPDEDPTVGVSWMLSYSRCGWISSEEGGSGQSTGYICSRANLGAPFWAWFVEAPT